MKNTVYWILCSLFVFYFNQHGAQAQSKKEDILRERHRAQSIGQNHFSDHLDMARNAAHSSSLLASETNARVLDAIIPDFQVNENAGGASQFTPAIASDDNGNFVLAWADRRRGFGDIYAQRYSAEGTSVGINFKINDHDEVNSSFTPAVTWSKKGILMIAWWDKRNGDDDIFAQRVASDGTALGANFRVNDDTGNTNQDHPAIASDAEGNFIITWQDDRDGRDNIYAQRFSEGGTALASNFRVSQGSGFKGNPAIATDSTGNFVITWDDDRDFARSQIYARRFAGDGTPLSDNFRVGDDLTRGHLFPAIAADADGNFVIAWLTLHDGKEGIVAQRYASDGSKSGGNFKVNDDDGSVDKLTVSAAMDAEGNFLISWRDERNGHDDIHAQYFTHNGSAQGSNFRVNDDAGEARQLSPASITTGVGKFVVAWTDRRNQTSDIYAQRFEQGSIAVGDNFKINDDFGSAEQSLPAMTLDSNGNFVIAWADRRNGDVDSYAQRYSSDGTALGVNFKVNDGPGSSFLLPPDIASDDNGNFVITWLHHRFPTSTIYAQRYASDGTASGSNFRVNDALDSERRFSPAVASDVNGHFIITWRDEREGSGDIYAQRYAPDGTPLGSNFRVNDFAPAFQTRPAIATDADGDFVVVWQDPRNLGYDDIYAQRYSDDGTASGANFKVNDSERTFQCCPAVAMDDFGNFVVTWYDESNEDIYTQRFASDGTALGSNFKVNEIESSGSPYSVAIAMDLDGNFVITWQDRRHDNGDIYAQRYHNDGSTFGENFRVTNTSQNLQMSPSVKLWNQRIYNVWTDNRTGNTSFDIWANVLDSTAPVSIAENRSKRAPSEFELQQNYPNPFNPSTTIGYSIPVSSAVEISIYNVQGQLVKSLTNQEQTAGTYQVRWNGTDDHGAPVSGGIYFYRLKAEHHAQFRRMILLR